MRYLILIVGFISVLPLASIAQDARVDSDIVRACHGTSPAYDPNPDCIGDASNACQRDLQYQDTPSIAGCISAEAAIWDDLLNDEYQRLQTHFAAIGDSGPGASGAELRTALRDSQRAWIAFRDAEYSLRYTIHLAGTIRSITGASCHMRVTADRALTLRDLLKP